MINWQRNVFFKTGWFRVWIAIMGFIQAARVALKIGYPEKVVSWPWVMMPSLFFVGVIALELALDWIDDRYITKKRQT